MADPSCFLSAEIREAGGELHGIILQEGRVGSTRAEVFAPFAAEFPTRGIAIRAAHGGAVETRAFPHRKANGEIHIRATATPALRDAIAAGRNRMSVEFRAIAEQRGAHGVREIQKAVVTGAALVDRPEYLQTSAELRSADDLRRRIRGLL